MAFFDWEDKYTVGVKELDDQHKKLFELVSAFYDRIHERNTARAMSEVLVGLIAYTTTHFTTEENYLRRYGYTLYERHLTQHAKFVDTVKDFQSRIEKSELLIPIEVADFLKKWLSGHILGEDQRYASFLKKEGCR
jgi:hemerythrin